MTLKQGQPDWLKSSNIILAEEKIPEHTNTGIKKGTPTWLILEETKETSDTPEWLTSSSEAPSWLSTDEKGNVLVPDLNRYQNWNLDYLRDKERIYLEERGFLNYCRGHDPKVIKAIINQIQYMERRVEQNITLDKVIKSNLPMIREKAELEELKDLKAHIDEKNTKILSDLNIKLDFKFPKKEDFKFNTDAESQHYQLTHVVFDVENRIQDQKPIACAAYNLETNRLCVAINSKYCPEKTGEFYLINDNIYLIYTPNLWECLFVADIEVLLSTIFESALMSGHNHFISLLDKLKLPEKLKINNRIMEEYLNGFPKRRSVWIGHNARFDIDMLNDTHKKAGYKFTFFQKRLDHEVVPYYMGRPVDPKKLKTNKEIRNKSYGVNHYKVHLGNHDAGFKFRVMVDNYSGKTIYRANLSPIQHRTFTHLWITDTIIVSFASQNPEHSLKALSKDTKFPKMDYPDLNFPLEQLDIYKQEKITKPVKYLLFDLFATLAVYEMESINLNYSEMEKLVKENGTPDFELKIDWRPRMANLLSTATIAKQFIVPYLEAKTGLKRETILNNIAHERKYLSNFEKVYSGGVSEPIVYGILESNFKTDERIFYDDFESLYPSVARLVYADMIYQLAAKKELHDYIKTDTEQTKQDFWDNIEKIVGIIRKALKGNKIELPENLFQRMIGTVQIYTAHPLQIRITNKNKRKQWKKLKGKQHLHLIDLMNAVIREIIEFNTDIHTLYNSINFINSERLDFGKIEIPLFGEELFTLFMKLRREKKAKENYDSVELMLKYIINSGIGVTAEGISSDDDFVGKLFIPVIFATVTAGSRFLIAIPEIMIKQLKGKMGYTDTDSLIYKIKSSHRPRITQLFDKLSKLKEEKDYGKIIKAFIAKKKKYYLLSENINEKKFKNLFVKLPDGKYIVGKVHGVSSYEKRLYVKTIFPIVNELMNNFTIKKPNIQAAVRKFIHKHPRFMNLNYKKKTETKIKGVLYFFQKTRAINVEYKEEGKKVKQQIRIPNPVFTLHKTQFDGFDIYFYYDLSANKILITNLDEKPIRSNFGVYTNLGKKRIKIFYTIPFENRDQLKWENRFLKLLIKTFYEKKKEFYFKIQEKQSEFILNFVQNTKKFLQEEFDESLKIDEENIDNLFATFFKTIKPPIPKTKRFFNRLYSPQEFIGFKADAKTKRWLEFANDYDGYLTGEFEGSSRTISVKEINDIIHGSAKDLRMFNQLLNRLGLNSVNPPTIREMKRLASDYQIPDRSKMDKNDLWFWVKDFWWRENRPDEEFENLLDRIQEMKDYSPDGRIHWIIDQLMDTQTVEYSHYLDTVGEKAKIELTEHTADDTMGKQYFDKFINNVIETFVKEAISKSDLETKLIKQFSYKQEDANRYIYEEKEKYLDLKVTKQKKETTSEEMLTHTILNHDYFTDGVDYRLWSYLPELDFSEELVANQNTFYSQNLINLGRIGTYIYYLTHNRAKAIPNIWNMKPEELPCPKTNRKIHIPLRMRLLLDTTKEFHSQNDIKLAFNFSEVNKMLRAEIIEKTKANNYNILNFKEFRKFTQKNVYNKAYMIFGEEKPESHEETFPIYHKRKYCGRAYAFEITSNKSYDYNSKLYIDFIVGENKKINQRTLSVDLHINPNSHNLLNIELFKANIKELETNDFIVRELLLGLFTVKELAYFSRNASLTKIDMKKKEDLSYLRRITYLFFSHAILEQAITENSQTKIGILSLTGQLVPKNIKPQELFSFLTKAIIDEHSEWINSLEPTKALRVQAKEISVMPHRSSFGLTVNHWKNQVHFSLYTKDRHWYKAKMSRTARSRNFEITEKLSKEIMGMVWEENTLRYEITLKGFDAIHCTEYHAVLADLEQFFFQLDEYFGKKKRIIKDYTATVKEIRKILPEPLTKTTYKTPIKKIIQLTGKIIKTITDNSGNTKRVKTKPKEIKIEKEKNPPDPRPVSA